MGIMKISPLLIAAMVSVTAMAVLAPGVAAAQDTASGTLMVNKDKVAGKYAAAIKTKDGTRIVLGDGKPIATDVLEDEGEI
jgi:hypothetical protein